MAIKNLLNRVKRKLQRELANIVFRNPLKMRNAHPLISFTFDDFPQSAIRMGGKILTQHGVRATYYTSLGLMGKSVPTGEAFERDDLSAVLEQGSELGCHTFHHFDAGDTNPRAFEDSIIQNRSVLADMLPITKFKTLSYPIHCPRPFTKRRASRHFACCRCGGQTYNHGIADLNHLCSFFIEKTEGDFAMIRAVVDEAVESGGWLIFSTHDVCDSHTRYGCTPKYFESCVRYALESGASILPVSEALEVAANGNAISA